MNLFEVAAALTLNTRAYKKGLQDAQKDTQNAAKTMGKAVDSSLKSTGENANSTASKVASHVKGVVSSVADGVKTLAKIGAAAFATMGAAAVKLTKDAVSQYAEYEQLAGGIQKLFGEGAETVLQNAQKAYATAAMSTNEYLQNATSFSASLLKSLGGDEKKAAELTDMMMRDIADNANTYGAYSAQELTEVYKALARGTYTTLDNLQIGFGGTKKGVKELVEEANRLRREMGGVGDLAVENFADIGIALHEVQVALGVSGLSAEQAAEAVASGAMTEEQAFNAMGTTAKEAAKTVSGSMTMLKKSAQDLVAGLANPNADIEKLIGNVMTSLGYAADNVIPTIERAISGLSQSIQVLAPNAEKFAEKFGEIFVNIGTQVGNAMPTIISSGAKIIEGIAKGIQKNQGSILSSAKGIITAISQTISTNLPTMLRIGSELLVSIVQGISRDLPELVKSAQEIIKSLAGELKNSSTLTDLLDAGTDILLTLVDALTDPDTLTTLFDAAAEILVKLGEGLGRNVGKIIEKAPDIISNLNNGLINNASTLYDASIKAVQAFLDGMTEYLTWENVGSILLEIVKLLANLLSQAFTGKNFTDLGQEFIDGFTEGVESGNWDGFLEMLKNALITIFKRVSIPGLFWSIFEDSDAENPLEGTGTGQFGRSGRQRVEENGYGGHGGKLDGDVYNPSVRGVSENGQAISLTGIKVNSDDLAAALEKTTVKTDTSEKLDSLKETADKYLSEYSEKIGQTVENGTSVLELLNQFLPYLPQLAALKVVLDSGVLVGQLTPMVNEALGALNGLGLRGNAI